MKCEVYHLAVMVQELARVSAQQSLVELAHSIAERHRDCTSVACTADAPAAPEQSAQPACLHYQVTQAPVDPTNDWRPIRLDCTGLFGSPLD